LIAAGLLIPVPLLSKEYSVKSPDGKISLSVETATGMTVTVKYDNREIISGLSPELQLEGVMIPGPKPAVAKAVTSSVSDVIVPVVPHKNSKVPDIYNGLTIRLRGGSSVEFRVYDDGVAYRFATAIKGDVTVKSERFGFALPAGTAALWPSEKGFMSHNECTFYPASKDTLGPQHLASLPALFTTGG
jgi:alpha-glucosidase